MGALNICLLNSLCNGEITLSLPACGRWKGGGFLSSVSPMGVCSLPMSHLGARHHLSRTKPVRYLLRSSRAINLCSIPWLPREHWGTARRGALQTDRTLANVPAFSVTILRDFPLSSLESVSCSLQRARWPPAKRTWNASRSRYLTLKEAKGLVRWRTQGTAVGTKGGWTETEIWAAGIRSCISILYLYTNSQSRSPFHSLWVWRLNETIYWPVCHKSWPQQTTNRGSCKCNCYWD